MKWISNILGFLLILFLGLWWYGYYQSQKPVSRDEFNSAHRYLNRRVDTVIIKVDNVALKVDSLKSQVLNLQKELAEARSDLDSLKKGQVIIYGAIRDLQSPQSAQSSFQQKLQLLYNHLFND